MQLLPGLPEPPTQQQPGAWDPSDHPREVLGIGVAAFTMLNLIGPAGLALSSMAGVSVVATAGAVGAAAAGSRKGGVKAAKVKKTISSQSAVPAQVISR